MTANRPLLYYVLFALLSRQEGFIKRLCFVEIQALDTLGFSPGKLHQHKKSGSFIIHYPCAVNGIFT